MFGVVCMLLIGYFGFKKPLVYHLDVADYIISVYHLSLRTDTGAIGSIYEILNYSATTLANLL